MKNFIAGIGLLCALTASGAAQDRFVDTTAQNRKVVLEEFTGINCGYCPDGHRRANLLREAHPGEVFILNVHQGSLATGTPDLRTSYGDALANQAGIETYPNATINRHVFSGYTSLAVPERNQWETLSESILDMEAYANIAARATVDWQTREMQITVQIYYTGNGAATNNLNIALLQDYIYGYQSGASSNPDQVDGNQYVHMHALRDLVTGQWGEEITTTTQGSLVEKTYTYTIPEAVRDIPVEMENISVVAFLAEGRTEIITACEANLSFTNGGPDYILHLSDFQQVPNHTCDNNVFFSTEVEVRNASQAVSSLTFNFESPSGTTEYTHTFEPALEAGSSVTFTSDSLPFPLNQDATASLSLVRVNDSENFPETDSMTASFSKYYMGIPSQEMILTVAQDQYGEEITWKLVSAAGDSIGYGGPYANLQNMGTRNRIDTLTLVDGCQQFTIYDAMGDGIHNTQGEGFIRFSDIDGNSLLARDGNYDDSAVVMISYNIPFESSNESAADQIKARLYPNPASNSAFLEFDMERSQKVSVRILNLAGQCVWNLGGQILPRGSQSIEIQVDRLSNGLYIVHIQGEGFQGSSKLIVNR